MSFISLSPPLFGCLGTTLVCVILLIFVSKTKKRRIALKQNGQKVLGKIVNIEKNPKSKQPTITYVYTPQNDKEISIPIRGYNTPCNIGDTITVMYDPNKPIIHMADFIYDEWLTRVASLQRIFILYIFIGIPIMYFVLSSLR